MIRLDNLDERQTDINRQQLLGYQNPVIRLDNLDVRQTDINRQQ